MNRRIAGLISVVLFCCIGAMWIDKQLYAAHKNNEKNNSAKPPIKAAVKAPDEKMPHVYVAAADEEEGDEEEAEGEKEIAIDEFDIKHKQKEVHNLVERAVEFCKSNPLTKICRAFTHTKDFIEGELNIFLFDTKGVVYAHGEREDLLWKNMWEHKDSFGALAVQSIIKTAQAGPNWITYEWSGATKVSFVQKVTIEGKDFVLGCGYYPHSKKYAAIGLVKGAVSLFNQDVAAGRPIEEAFSSMGYALSERFIFGDLYIYALDFNGIIRAQGDDPNLIGANALERKDAKGKAINKEIIAKLKDKEEGQGIWMDYTSKNALKYTYAEKVKDAKGNYYFIACGYYPEIDRDKTVDLVRRGYQYMKGSGVTVAAKDFTDKAVDTYRLGDLYLMVFDMKGKCIAHGDNSTLVGSNQFDAKDQDGAYYVRELIDQANAGGGWVDVKLNNSFQSIYVEKIDMGIDKYVICSGIFPVAKPETMILLAKNAIGYLQTHNDDEAFEKFVSGAHEFNRGDLEVFVVDLDGFCYAWGEAYELIWKNLLDWKDDEGKPFVKQMIDQSLQGAGHFVYKFNKRIRVDYIEQVEKGNKKYLVGSGFYK